MLQSCDTMVALSNATRNGQTIFAKNSDRPADECQPLVLQERRTHPPHEYMQCQFLRLPQVETTYRHVGSRPYWCWGYEHGFNEHQVVIGNEALPSRLTAYSEPKLVGMEILRLGLERARTAPEAVEVMTDLITRYGQGKFDNQAGVRTYDNGYIIADPQEAFVLETAGHEWAVKPVDQTTAISNVYAIESDWAQLSPRAEARAAEAGWWLNHEADRFNFAEAYSSIDRTEGSGAMRRARSCAVLGHRIGEIDARTMMALLSDHGSGQANPDGFEPGINPGTGICVHSQRDENGEYSGGNTAASLVADLCAGGSRLPVYWCNFYSPCLGLFLPIFIEGTLPPVLAKGSETPSDDSPWWLFHRLSGLAREEVSRISSVRDRWARLQTRLFESAYQVAEKAQNLRHSGQDERARRLLSDYMAENVDEMLAVTLEMLSAFELKSTPA